MSGQKVCHAHGGRARQNRAAAERRLTETVEREKAEAAVATYGLPREIDPHTALLEELHRTAGHVSWLWLQVQEMESDELHVTYGGGEYSDARQDAHIWVKLYQEERRHYAMVARDCIKAGIEERRVQLAEQQAQLIAQFARGLMAEFGIDPGSEQARLAFRKHLTLVSGG